MVAICFLRIHSRISESIQEFLLTQVFLPFSNANLNLDKIKIA